LLHFYRFAKFRPTDSQNRLTVASSQMLVINAAVFFSVLFADGQRDPFVLDYIPDDTSHGRRVHATNIIRDSQSARPSRTSVGRTDGHSCQ